MSQHSAIIDGSVVVTDHQTAGRGQRGSTWESQGGKNLTLSLILKPTFLSAKDQFFLNIFTSLAIHDLLKDKTGATVNIKWPNDLLMNGRKLCGILIENQIQGLQVSNCIIGIGINVNQTDFATASATSMRKETSLSYDLSALFTDLMEKLERRYLQLREGKRELLKSAYLQHLHWINEQRTFQDGNGTFAGTIDGIDASGKLKIVTATGERLFDVRQVTYIS